MKLVDSLIKTISNSDLTALSGELGEVIIDSTLEDGVLKDIPIVGSMVGLFKTGVTIKDALFTKKLIVFLQGLSDIPIEKRNAMIESLDDPKTNEKAGEKLLIIIERLDSSEKAKILAKAFRVYIEKSIDRDEFWRVTFIINNLPLSDIVGLKEWKSIELNNVEHIRKHLYMTVGLGWFVINMSSTGFQWEEKLCSIFTKHLLA